jgi:hypothetical protein
MPEDESAGEKKDSIKKELIQEIRAISRDEAIKRKIEDGIFGEAESVKGSVLTVVVRAFDNLERRLETESAKSAQLESATRSIYSEVKGELNLLRNQMKDLNVRIIETMEKNFGIQRRSIESIPLPLERAIIEIPKGLSREVQEMKGASDKLGKDLAEVGKLNTELRESLADMHKTLKDFSDGLRQFHESLDIQKSRIDEMSQMVQSKVDKMSVVIDDKTTTLAEKMQFSINKLGAFEATLLTFSVGMKGVESKSGEIEKRLADTVGRINDRIDRIEKTQLKAIEDSRVRNEEIKVRLEMLAATIIGIGALEEFVKSIEKKIDGSKVDITGIENDIEEIKMNLDSETVLNSLREMQVKLEAQADVAAQLLSGNSAKIDNAPLQKSIDELHGEIQNLTEKHSKSIKEIQSRINALQRAVEMRE